MKARQNSKRENFLLGIFPAAIVIAVYSILFVLPTQKDRVRLSADLEKAQSSAVPSSVAEVSRQAAQSERMRLVSLKQSSAQATQQVASLCADWKTANRRLDGLETITTLMRDFNLSILSQGRDDGATVSTYQQDLFRMFNSRNPLDPVELWNVKVNGSYTEVANFLIQIGKSGSDFIPVALTMEGPSREKTWSIVFAI